MTPLSSTGTASRALAAELSASGALRTAAWRHAVERVPRDLFVPRFYRGDCERGIDYELVDGARPDHHQRWLSSVYSPDASLVTAYDPRTLYPTTSATMPRIVVAMLEALAVEPGQRVLEIGTGSGYSTALLCERLGSEHVTTVDIGQRVVELARRRLREAGYTPHGSWATVSTATPRAPPTTASLRPAPQPGFLLPGSSRPSLAA